ncbi:MAG: hypothetical protein E7316_11185 [Clostridiales bacterium]|nr:hypothetical protein [Clostridiales bacterium]
MDYRDMGMKIRTLRKKMGLKQNELAALLEGMGASLYAVCDDFGLTQLAVVTTPGIGFIDMRDFGLDADAFLSGFLSSYPTATDSGLYKTNEAIFAYVRYSLQDDAGSTSDIIQYVTNTNGTLYVIQLMGMYGTTLDDASVALLKQAVDSLTFTQE